MDSHLISLQNAVSGPVALITGGGRGLGRGFAFALASAGFRVAVLARSAAQVNETARLIQEHGGIALAIPADVRDSQAINDAVALVEEKLGPIELLISNAGIFGPIGPIFKVDRIEWEDTVTTNIMGTRNCIDAVLRQMIPRRKGRIIIVASSTPLHTKPNFTAYAASKTFLIKLAEEIAPEVQEFGISIFSIHPGTIKTAMSRRLLDSPEGKEYLPWFQANDEIGGALDLVLFLASGDADSVSGRYFDATKPYWYNVRLMKKYEKEDVNLLRIKFTEDFMGSSPKEPQQNDENSENLNRDSEVPI